MANRLQNKTAIITGGSGSIGTEIGRRYLKEGAKIILTDIKESDSEAKLIADNNMAVYMNQDVTKESDWKQVVDETIRQFGHLDILVNNAGIIPKPQTIDKISLEEWDKILNVNLTGNFLGIKQALKNMKKGGSIVNISSIKGLVGTAGGGPYNVSKGGSQILTKVSALDSAYNNYKIRINSVSPGFIKTSSTSKAKIKQVDQNIPMGHFGFPDDISEICVYLGSNESKYVTGSNFVIDGGYLAQ